MKRIQMFLAATTLFSPGLLSAAPAGAAGTTSCAVGHVPTLTPGLSAQGSSGTFEDRVLGTISCDGPVKGITPIGRGRLHDQGRYGTSDPDSCFGGGEGDGAYTIVFPTADGDRTLVIPFTFTFGDPSTHGGLVAIHLHGEGMSGELGATPTDGDCVTKPVTKVRVTGEVVFSHG